MSAAMMTTAEVAVYLGLSEQAVRDRVHKRSIPFKKLGPHRNARLRFRRADIDRWLAASSETTR